MAIRTNTNPRAMDLQPEMRDILMRNGLQAHIAFDGGGYKLIVQGHDSPLLTYPITEKQLLALTDWGTNTANKKAYNVLTSILAKDFYLPKNFVHARNANGRVAMGLHGYRIGMGEYGSTALVETLPNDKLICSSIPESSGEETRLSWLQPVSMAINPTKKTFLIILHQKMNLILTVTGCGYHPLPSFFPGEGRRLREGKW